MDLGDIISALATLIGVIGAFAGFYKKIKDGIKEEIIETLPCKESSDRISNLEHKIDNLVDGINGIKTEIEKSKRMNKIINFAKDLKEDPSSITEQNFREICKDIDEYNDLGDGDSYTNYKIEYIRNHFNK